jgi:hypothetical protein
MELQQKTLEQQMMDQQSRAVNAMRQNPYGNALGSNSALMSSGSGGFGSGGNGIWSNLF